MGVLRNKNFIKNLLIAVMTLVMSLTASAALAHVITGIVDDFGINYSSNAQFRLYDINVPSSIGTGPMQYASNYTIAYHLTNSDMDNLAPTHSTGDTAVIIFDRELNGATINHAGYYSVTDALLNGPSQVINWNTVYAIPVPVATVGGPTQVNLSWAPATDDGTGNILGYNVYRSENGIDSWVKVNATTIPGTNAVDTTVVPGVTYYYAIKVVFRGTIATPELETLYLSANSNPISVGGASILYITPDNGNQGETLNVKIVGQSTNFTAATTANFGAGITVNYVSYIDATHIIANISIAGGATLGTRTVTVTSGAEIVTAVNAFTVNAAGMQMLLYVVPDNGNQGETLNVKIVGSNTVFSGSPAVTFSNPGITVNSTDAISATEVVANITIAGGAATGPCNVTVGGLLLSNGFTVNAVGTAMLLYASPDNGDQGMTGLNVHIFGSNTNFTGSPSVAFTGSGITVNYTTAITPTELVANIDIAAGAAVGYRSIIVNGSLVLMNGFRVNAVGTTTLLYITPDNADQGDSLTVTIVGYNTSFDGTTNVTFSNPGITVNSVNVIDALNVEASITISGAAPVGPCDVTATNAGVPLTLINGFTVNALGTPELLTIVPSTGMQGTTGLVVTVTGLNTSFNASTTLAFSGSGITVNSITVLGLTQFTANIDIDVAAPLGFRDVIVTTGTQIVSLANGFEVTTSSTVDTPLWMDHYLVERQPDTTYSVYVNWGAVAGAASYDLRYRIQGTSTWTEILGLVNPQSNPMDPNPNYQLTGLTGLVTYEVSVRANDGIGGSSAWFDPPHLMYMIDTPWLGHYNIYLSGVTFNVTMIWMDVYGATSYVLQYWPEGGATQEVYPLGGTTTMELTGLTPNVRYYARIKAVRAGGDESLWSNTDTFMTVETPLWIDHFNVTATNAHLIWQHPITGALSYTISYGTDSDATNLGEITGLNDTDAADYLLSSLTPNTWYFVKVKAVHAAGDSDWSPIDTFYTLQAPWWMSHFGVTTNSAHLSWEAIAAATTYTLRYDTDPNFGTAIVTTGITNPDDHFLTGLASGTAYYCQVRSENAGGYSDWSPYPYHMFVTNSDTWMTIDHFEGTEGINHYSFGTSAPTVDYETVIYHDYNQGWHARYNYTTGWGGGWGGTLPSALDISSMDSVSFWIMGDGSQNRVRFELVDADGDVWSSHADTPGVGYALSDTGWQQVVVPYSVLTLITQNGNGVFDGVITNYNFVYTTQYGSGSYHYVDTIIAQTLGGPTAAELIAVYPYWGFQGTTVEAVIVGSGTSFSPSSMVSFTGLNHVTASSVSWISDTMLTVVIDISSEAVIGPRNVVVTTSAEVVVGNDMFWVVSDEVTFILDPSEGFRGQTLDVNMIGTATNFNVSTQAYFGADISVNSLNITSALLADANITISSEAFLGNRVVIMWDGTDMAIGDFVVLESNFETGFIPNYPNPFDPLDPNPEMNITHIVIPPLDEPTTIGVYIYDITARQVWKYVVDLPASSLPNVNDVIWDGYTYFGKLADNGVYLLRVIKEDSKEFIGKGKVFVIKRYVP